MIRTRDDLARVTDGYCDELAEVEIDGVLAKLEQLDRYLADRGCPGVDRIDARCSERARNIKSHVLCIGGQVRGLGCKLRAVRRGYKRVRPDQVRVFRRGLAALLRLEPGACPIGV